jgi:hypothetical protein
MQHKMGAFEFTNGLLEVQDKTDYGTERAIYFLLATIGESSMLQLEDNRWFSVYWTADFDALRHLYKN